MSYYLLLKPGETIISYRGRYREHLLISNHKANEQLFGSVLHPLDNDFPRLTKHFISKMKELGVSRSMIINDHTSFPFYKNFFTNERTESIRDFINDKNRFVGALLSFSNGIRYCPLCVKSDLENDHETYWRREHNLSSIQTCTIHDCFLNSVKASVINKTKLSPNQIDFYNLTAIFNNNKLLSQFDKGLVEILHGRITFQREELVRAALKKGFIERKPSNKYFMNKTELEEFRKYALAVTGKNDFTKQQFLNKVFNNNWNGYCPELYILLQDFLKPRPNIKTESSFKADFKCINQSCSDFNKLGENTSVTNSLYRKGLVYVSCSTCGMCYRINLLIKPIAPKLVFAGSLVQVELKRLSQSGMTMEAASQRLGISRIHLKQIIKDEHQLPDFLKSLTNNAIKQKRKDWMRLLNSKNFVSIKQTSKLNQRLYNDLRRWDRQWIIARNIEYRKRSWKIKSREYYEDLDKDHLKQLHKALGLLLNKSPEVRVSISSLSEEVGVSFYNKSTQFPRSFEFAKKNSESLFQFKIRRLVNFLRKTNTGSILYTKSHLKKQFSFRSYFDLNRAIGIVSSQYLIIVKFK